MVLLSAPLITADLGVGRADHQSDGSTAHKTILRPIHVRGQGEGVKELSRERK